MKNELTFTGFFKCPDKQTCFMRFIGLVAVLIDVAIRINATYSEIPHAYLGLIISPAYLTFFHTKRADLTLNFIIFILAGLNTMALIYYIGTVYLGLMLFGPTMPFSIPLYGPLVLLHLIVILAVHYKILKRLS